MVETNIRAILFAKNLSEMVTFYKDALGFGVDTTDNDHAVLRRNNFELILHQLPINIANDRDC